ncbi:MAG: pilus assembly protein PilM [Rickettsiella sp.]|nr:pilus assembly protein PilM [Rickettsiella sp.]
MRFIKNRFKVVPPKYEVIGLDIAASTVKCVVLNNSEPFYTLEKYCIQTLPVIQESTGKTCSEIAAHIKSMLINGGIFSKKCIASLPNSLVISKWIRIDNSATENLEFAVNLAVEEHIPYPLDAICFDYQVFEIPDQDYLDVFLVACRKEYLDILLEIISQANLIPLFIEINSHAIERAYMHLYSEYNNNKSFILLDVAKTQLTFMFSIESKKVHSYCEKIIDFTNKARLLEQIDSFIRTVYLSYPYFKFNNFFLLGSNFLILQQLVEEFNVLYGFKMEIMKRSPVLIYSENLDKKEIDEKFPGLVLSIGLALRGFIPTSENVV